jgi:hypothetical protein
MQIKKAKDDAELKIGLLVDKAKGKAVVVLHVAGAEFLFPPEIARRIAGDIEQAAEAAGKINEAARADRN